MKENGLKSTLSFSYLFLCLKKAKVQKRPLYGETNEIRRSVPPDDDEG